MATISAAASNQRPTVISRAFDAHRHLRLLVVIGALGASVALLSFVLGHWHDDRLFEVDTNFYVATAGLFIVALAIERLTELLIAPWVGRNVARMERNILIGSFTVLIGVGVSGLLGLRLLALLRGDFSPGSGWWGRNVAPAIEVLATGLAIGAGGKPLHDLITRLDNSVTRAKRSDETDDSPPPPPLPVPVGGAYRLAVAVPPSPGVPEADLVRTVNKLLPGWETTTSPGSVLVHCTTDAVPGSAAYVGQVFSAAHRLHSVGLEPTIPPAPVQVTTTATLAPTPRGALDLLGVTAELQRGATGGRGIVVAVIDTGLRRHPDGVDPARVVTSTGSDVLGNDDDPTDPLLTSANWIDLDVMGSAGHGTGTAAVVVAGGEAGTARHSVDWWEHSPMIGVAPEATVAPFRVMRGPVHLLDDDVAKGVRRATAAGCHVLSMSLGGLAFRRLGEAIDDAVADGVIVVCAAGNQFGVVVEPASYPNTIAVASVGLDGQPFVDGSSRRAEVTISAPGLGILRPDFRTDADGGEPTATLEFGTGTTYATAHVAGVAALWLAKHGRQRLLDAYGGARLSQLFAYVLGQTADQWEDADLAADWGPGRVNVQRLLDHPVLDAGGGAIVSDRMLAEVFERKGAVAVTSRFAGGLAGVLRADGLSELRSSLFGGLLKLWDMARGRARQKAPDPSPALTPAASSAQALLRAEMSAHAGANPAFRTALASATDTLPVPVGATPELQLVVNESNRRAGALMPDDWGVGLSLPLRRALQGRASMVRGYRWVGLAALLVAVVVVVVLYDPNPPDGPSAAAIGSAVGLLGIGLYGGAQAIERLLELTVGRWAFKDVPGRETDRALIMLGAGILLGTLTAVVLHVGLLQQVATRTPGDAWFGRADVVITGLALGGGAKPLHDLLSKIRLAGK